MRGPRFVVALLVLLALPAGAWAKDGGRPVRHPCPDEEAAVGERCPCDGQTNHGQYVKCVVRYGNALRKAGCSWGTALRLIHCAALSTCGKPGGVVCCTTSAGTCDAGVCSNRAWL